MLRSRLGTEPPPVDATPSSDPPEPRLGLSVALNRPFHELKQYLLDELERAYLTRCLEEAAMNLSAASRASGLSRKHIRTLMSKHGFERRAQQGEPAEPQDEEDAA